MHVASFGIEHSLVAERLAKRFDGSDVESTVPREEILLV
jgi:hypothetical protein